jgi:N-acetylmuramoyl-L-alanine amidase
MGFFSQRKRICGGGVWGVVVLAGCGCVGAGAQAVAHRVSSGAWDRAVAARAAFEAEPVGTHTKAEYAETMDGFRAIYHGDPGDVHAAPAVEQVAQLLAEEGNELGDEKALRDAQGQFAFLEKAYPAYAKKVVRAEVAADGGVKGAVAVQPRGNGVEGTAGHTGAEGARLATRDDKTVANGTFKGSGDSSFPSHDDKTVMDGTARSSAGVVREEARLKPVAVVKGTPAVVTGIRHWSTTSYTRVAIDLSTADGDDDVTYQAARVENPDRIFFDVHHAKLGPTLEGKSFSVMDDGFLTKIRAAQYSEDVTRVVLDVHAVAEYSAFLLPNPTRLIIDIHGKTGSREQGAGSRDAVGAKAERPMALANVPMASAVGTVVAPKTEASGAVETSSLPPMPVTDGSSGFGLPARGTEEREGRTVAVARPRVVISSKPTSARPVPNTVAKSSVDNGSEVAAVSRQPGKVEATRRPTSGPVSSGSREEGVESSKALVVASRVKSVRAGESARVAGEPVTAAPPTADGETLVRALGLKIGRIVIDAGHGGHDSGTLGAGGIEEKDVVLDVALRLGKLLHDRLGAEIVYTRADDTFIPLETRTAIANKAQADLFISVHANSSQDASARGVEVYYLNFTSDPDAMRVAARENAVSTQSVHDLSDLVKKIALKDKIDESKELATDVDSSLYAGLRKGNEGLKDRGVKKAPFVVLIGANMPSILAEISFVTNPEDAAQLRTEEYRERVAESLYGGVAKYAAEINGMGPAKVAGAKGKTTERAAVR